MGPIRPFRPFSGKAAAFFRLLACLMALPQMALAGIGGLQDGRYDAFDCAPAISDTRIEVTGDRLAFYESSCRLSNPQSLRDLAGPILLDAACEGEGETWTTRFILTQTRDGGLAMMQEGWGDHYARCN